MKNKILISYDLHGPEKDYEVLTDAIIDLDSYRILDSVWVVKTDQSPSEIVQFLKKYIDKDDKLFVTQIGDWDHYNLIERKTKWLSR